MKLTQLMVRYLREFVLALFAYFVILVASNSILMKTPSKSMLQILVALAPVVPVFLILRPILKLLAATDELQQRIQLNAIGFAAVTTGLLTFSYGSLELLGYPHINPIWFLPIMIMLWGVGLTYFSRKYQ